MSFAELQDNSDREILVDRSSTGRVRPWKEKKMANDLLSHAYVSINLNKARRLRDCASFLMFLNTPVGTKLHRANFCRVRLCPLCQWRRTLKLSAQMNSIFSFLHQNYNYAYLFLTLTVRNCNPDELSPLMDDMFSAWARFIKHRDVAPVVKGWYRGFEVTHNLVPNSPFYDTFHPHFHCVLAVDPNYFKSKDYLSKARWSQLWKQALRIDYDPIIDVRRCKGTDPELIAEAAKYSVKESDLLIPDDWDLTVDTLRCLDAAFTNRHFIGFGGRFREVHRILHLDDTENGDLIATSPENITLSDALSHTVFVWDTGFRQYYRE